MIRKASLSALSAALSGVCLIQGASATELRGLSLATGPAGAQLTLELSGAAANHHLFTLDHPNRVVLDLTDTHLLKGMRPPAPAGVVSGVRLGRQPHGTLRVVVELKGPLTAHATSGKGEGGRRLVLTLGEPAVTTTAGVTTAAAGEGSHAPITAARTAVHARELAAGPAAEPAVPGATTSVPATVPAVSAAVNAAPASSKVVRAAHAPGDAERDVVVAVDAGHGGQDPGAIGHGGTREKDVTLAIARALAERINAEPGMRAVLTRDRDEFLELRDRIHRARVARADMFVSVHADSIADRSISGASVYVLSVHGASNEAARWLAERENAADLMGGVRLDDKGTLAPVLLDATQSEIIGVSASAAERVVGALENVGEVRKAQVQHAGFVVLKSPDIPSMLVETAYISNPAEERRLRQPAQQSRLADAVFTGLR